ncbi:hypothetical protein ACTQ6A_13695 [Lachnospiraceae bacterium LCP25S3_G4]
MERKWVKALAIILGVLLLLAYTNEWRNLNYNHSFTSVESNIYAQQEEVLPTTNRLQIPKLIIVCIVSLCFILLQGTAQEAYTRMRLLCMQIVDDFLYLMQILHHQDGKRRMWHIDK